MIVIVGVTASGKSALAMKLAQAHDGEIVCADSRTIYKGMDVGTAKPTKAEQDLVRHHLLDVITPDQTFTAAEFQRQANAAIADIQTRDKLPILVGGSGLYVDGVLYDFKFLPPASAQERERLSKMTIEELQAEINAKGLKMPENKLNPRYLMRTIEKNGAEETRGELRPNTLVIGIAAEDAVVRGRIKVRIKQMMEDHLVEETRMLVKRYGWEAPGLLSTSYKALRPFLEGQETLREASAQFALNDWHLAKRQRAWFKRNSEIQWFADAASALAFAENWLIASSSKGQKANITSEL